MSVPGDELRGVVRGEGFHPPDGVGLANRRESVTGGMPYLQDASRMEMPVPKCSLRAASYKIMGNGSLTHPEHRKEQQGPVPHAFEAAIVPSTVGIASPNPQGFTRLYYTRIPLFRNKPPTR